MYRIRKLKIFSVVLLPALKPASSSVMIFSTCDFNHDLQHDFAWMADEADTLVVLALLQVAFFGKCDDQGLGPQDCHSPVCQILFQIVVKQ